MTELVGVRLRGVAVQPTEPWRMPVTEPATGEVIADLVGGGTGEAQAALQASSEVLPHWAGTAAADRADALRAIASDLRTTGVAESIARLISRETGKRIAESRAEITLSARFFEWFADAVLLESRSELDLVEGTRHTVAQRPLGVVAVATPWNFPVSIPARKLAPALAAGCTVLFKPSEIAPGSALQLAEIVDAHLPPGTVNTVIGDPAQVLGCWLGAPAVRGLTFTGSTRVGRILAGQVAQDFTRCVLELGGNAPFVVLEDADMQQAVDLLMVAKYRNNGQSCIAANQAWVPRKRLSDFTDAFLSASKELTLGDPLDESTTLGPVALPSDSARLEDLLRTAGGTVFATDHHLPDVGQFVMPALCVEPDRTSRMVTEEVFGPMLAIRGYETIDEVLSMTATSVHGLGGYVVGDPESARATGERLDVGIVGVNNATPNAPQVPFAGLKHSGIGVEGAMAGLDAFRTYQTIAVSQGR